ncbi:MAG: hypothetical protein AAGE94_16470, partial [Acidobacteriota bacterium]
MSPRKPNLSSRSIWALALLAVVVVALPAEARKVRPEVLETARADIPEALLLDVGIEIFDPGLPSGDEYAEEENGVYPDIRKAEARFLAVHLAETLQSTGLWGAVRVVPDGTDTVDLRIRGRILHSDGLELEVEVEAIDTTGERWLDRKYEAEARGSAYRDQRGVDPFQDLYDVIANDLNDEREDLDIDDVATIRQIAGLRFAHDLAPDAFSGYLQRDRRGRTKIVRLPATGDPMLDRVQRVRERDELFIDTLTDHYANFRAQMSEPYEHWRQYSYEEALNYKEVRRQATWRQVLGGLAILGAVLADTDSQGESVARDIAIYGGIAAIENGIGKAQEAKLHKEALKELALSFDAEVQPLLVDVEGQTLKLTGSVEQQVE